MKTLFLLPLLFLFGCATMTPQQELEFWAGIAAEEGTISLLKKHPERREQLALTSASLSTAIDKKQFDADTLWTILGGVGVGDIGSEDSQRAIRIVKRRIKNGSADVGVSNEQIAGVMVAIRDGIDSGLAVK